MTKSSTSSKNTKSALLLIDIQNDFLEGGALAVPSSNAILPVVQKLIPKFQHVIATQDWHPKEHISFASTHHKKVGEIIQVGDHEQILWPDHCIQNTKGAELASLIDQDRIEKIFLKGTDPNLDSYSAFFDNAKKRSTGLDKYLKEKGYQKLFVAGLATDYCVLFSVLDALALGFEISIIVDACAAVNVRPDDGEKALEKMKNKGAHLITSLEG